MVAPGGAELSLNWRPTGRGEAAVAVVGAVSAENSATWALGGHLLL